MNKNKRKYNRLEKPIVVAYKVKRIENKNPASPKNGWAAVEDLGSGGVFFECEHELNIGSIVDLKIGASASTHINCSGKIIRVNEKRGSGMYGVAIELEDISEDEKEIINNL